MAIGKYNHDRQYELVVLGATGYTGVYTAESIAASFPTDLSWAIAGRSQDKLEKVAAGLKALNPDRRDPEIEVCNLDDDAGLASLAKKTFILITTVGPYCRYGEPAFRACAEHGTHYLDVTGEVNWVHEMIEKYEDTAQQSKAMMFPQIGLESAPSDLCTWSLASIIREKLHAPTRDVTLSFYDFKANASGGSLATILAVFEKYGKREMSKFHAPFALSPVPHPNAKTSRSRGSSLITRLTGVVTVPGLGMLTTFFGADANASIVERSWGLFSQMPARKDQFYGPNFSYAEFARPKGWLHGFAMHWGAAIGSLLLGSVLVRALIRRLVFKPGEGVPKEVAAKERLEIRAVANPDLEGSYKQAHCRMTFEGGIYHLTGILLAQAALTILQDYEDLKLEGGIYTPACLGQNFIDRLDGGGLKLEKKLVTV